MPMKSQSLLLVWFAVPVSFAICFALVSHFAPLEFSPPFEKFSVERKPYWRSPRSPTGSFEANHELENAKTLFDGKVIAPETIKFDESGAMFLFTEEGIFSAQPNGKSFEDPKLFFNIEGGRPLGGEFGSDGNLYYCDPIFGLVKLDLPSRKHEILVSSDKIHLCDDVTIASSGDIYIADATGFTPTSKSSLTEICLGSVMQGGVFGRLLKYSPFTRDLEVIADNLTFPSGLELSSDESHLIVCEGNLLQYNRHWLEGPSKGSSEIFVGNLPGYPDNVGKGSNGTYWMVSLCEIGVLWKLVLSSRLLRWLTYHLPKLAAMMNRSHGIVFQVDEEGNVLRSFHDTSGHFGAPTSATEKDGKLYIGNLHQQIKVLELESVQ